MADGGVELAGFVGLVVLVGRERCRWSLDREGKV